MKPAIEVRVGDCLDESATITANSVDLIYLDPPFFTNRNHTLITKDRLSTYTFSDRWSSRNEYLEFLHIRLREFHRILSRTGSLFFHCDSNASHYIRCLLDEVFGGNMFRAEIIWHYLRWTNSQRAPIPAHQTIFFYSKSEHYKYNKIYADYSPSTNIDQILQRRIRDQDGKTIYERDEAGNAIIDGNKRGVPVSDVWDIPLLNPKAQERTGYPTQKPLLLLERILTIASDPGDLVLDPFCGSGTTLVAAQFLGRSAVGIDISRDAVSLAQKRLKNPIKTESGVLLKGRNSYRQADFDALSYLHGLPVVTVHRNKGIDAILPTRAPVFFRVQRKGEALMDAMDRLKEATRSKGSGELVVIITEPDLLGLEEALSSSGVTFVESTAVKVRNFLERRSQEAISP